MDRKQVQRVSVFGEIPMQFVFSSFSCIHVELRSYCVISIPSLPPFSSDYQQE